MREIDESRRRSYERGILEDVRRLRSRSRDVDEAPVEADPVAARLARAIWG